MEQNEITTSRGGSIRYWGNKKICNKSMRVQHSRLGSNRTLPF